MLRVRCARCDQKMGVPDTYQVWLFIVIMCGYSLPDVLADD